MPLSIAIGPRNEHDFKRLTELVSWLDAKPREPYADTAYDTEGIRSDLSSMDIEPNIPVNPRNGRRPRHYNVELYRRVRSAVERFFALIKSFRRLAIRYERLVEMFSAFMKVECIIIYIRRRKLK